ncbi:hypothetical protein ACFL35_15710, partial [Candidatus Riflebacteria bacterium]
GFIETLALCKKFNPMQKTNEHKKLEKEIARYLKYLESLPVIQYALKITGTDMKAVKKNWFGPGRGFEHIFAGELKGTKVSGYHWWYCFYADERKGKAFYKNSIEGQDDSNIFTGVFRWDPDADGPIKPALKSKGGFSVGHSAEALIALGHVALELGRKMGKKNAYTFRANINGREYLWQIFLYQGSIRSLYPMVPKRANADIHQRIQEYLLELQSIH